VVRAQSAEVASTSFQETSAGCDGCLTDANMFTNCINQYCDENDPCFDTFYDAQDLGKCCGMPQGGECKKAGKQAQKCFDTCLPSCVKVSTNDFFDCTFKYGGTTGCDRADCFQKLALDREWMYSSSSTDSDSSDDTDFFLQLGDHMQTMSDDDAESCVGATDKAKEVCGIGDDCCKSCNGELSAISDCLVNEVVRPYLSDKRSVTLNRCYVDCGPALLRQENRQLQEEEGAAGGGNTTNTTHTATTANGTMQKVVVVVAEEEMEEDYSYDTFPFGPGTENLDPDRTEFMTRKCRNRLTGLLAAGNETRGLSDHLSCVLGESFAKLPDDSTWNTNNDETKKTSSAASSSSCAAVVVVSGGVSLLVLVLSTVGA